jgi:hypothetical protein
VTDGAAPVRELDDDTWTALLAIAAAAEPAVRRAFLDAIASIRGSINARAVEAALARQDVNAVLALVPIEQLDVALAAAELNLDPIRADAFLLGRDAAAPLLHAEQLAFHLGDRATLSINWQHVSPNVLEAIRSNAGRRVTGISDLTRKGLARFLEQSFARGEHPNAIAKAIGDAVGLTPAQSDQVDRVRLALQDEDVKPSTIARRVAQLQKRKLKQRGQLIARTETMRAGNDGQLASWRTLVERGLLDDNRYEREWLAIVPSDGRTCPICEGLDGIRAPIGGDYTPEEAKGGAPQHPDCRCTERLVPVASGSGA